MRYRLILASASPQRKTLLEGLGLDFEVIPSTVDEPAHPEENPVHRARDLAMLKARDVASRNPDAWVIGCDTLVVAEDGTLLEKPADADDARRMIGLQSGKSCMVHSGLTLRAPDGREFHGMSSSKVTFRPLSEADKDWWIGTRLWEGRSGSFQIDGPGQLMISRIEGDWSSIVGFPVFLFGELSRQAEVPFSPRAR